MQGLEKAGLASLPLVQNGGGGNGNGNWWFWAILKVRSMNHLTKVGKAISKLVLLGSRTLGFFTTCL